MTDYKEYENQTTVSDILVEQMVQWGVKYIFGLPGISCIGMIEAIRKNNKIKFILVRHEQTAAFMASAYGKLTGNIAACLTIGGPGATNLTTGLYDAKFDHSPVLVLTGWGRRQLVGLDQHLLFEPICVFNKALISEDQTTKLITLAIKHALTERGVSHISIPTDMQKFPYNTKIIPLEGRFPDKTLSPSPVLIEKSASLIDKAKRPVIVAGFGAVENGDELLKLAEKITAPIVTTFRAKGVVDESHELCAGCHGSIGTTIAHSLVKNSDLLIVIGSSLVDVAGIPEKKMIQIDIDPMVIGNKYPVEVGLWGNSSKVIPALINAVTERKNNEYLAEIKRLKKEWIDLLEKEADSTQMPIRPQYLIKVLNEKLSKDAVIALDVGENSWWFGRNFFMNKSQKIALSGYTASMGSGLPGALAAQLIYPEKQVICITGDGGFAMVMGDFLTAIKYSLPVIVFLFNNKQLGLIKQTQIQECCPNSQTDLCNCDFAAYAESCGGIGIRVTDPKDLPLAVENALSVDKPVIVDIDVAECLMDKI